MHQRRKKAVPSGPALRGEMVSELWVWIWSAIDGRGREDQQRERDEAQRLAVAFERAVGVRDAHDSPYERFGRDQDALSTALLAHYLVIRTEQWTGVLQRAERVQEARERLRIILGASELFGALLGLTPRQLSANFERLEIGTSQRSVFRPQAREGVTIESLEEGPVLPSDSERRTKEAQARWNAQWEAARNRPKKRRALAEVLP